MEFFENHVSWLDMALGHICNHIYLGCLHLCEHVPAIVYIKGIGKSISDSVSHLEYSGTLTTQNINIYLHGNLLARLGIGCISENHLVAKHSK